MRAVDVDVVRDAASRGVYPVVIYTMDATWAREGHFPLAKRYELLSRINSDLDLEARDWTLAVRCALTATW